MTYMYLELIKVRRIFTLAGEIEMTGIKRKRKLSDLNSSEDGFQRMARMMRMDFKGGRAWYLITGAEHLNQGNLL